jgi:ribosomal protein S18 acetylase RimI-like enzyme
MTSTRTTDNITLRRAEAADIPRIAALHVASWRAAYRGILSDRFLDGPVEAERLAMWQGRCGADLTRWPLMLVAEDGKGREGGSAERAAATRAGQIETPGVDLAGVRAGAGRAAPLAGFICVFPEHDARWGSLVDNLHVAPGRTGQGIGRRLMHAAATILIETRCLAPVHLWVYADNHGARAAYERFGGRAVEQYLGPAPDGHQVMAVRYAWDGPSALLSA